MSFSLLIHSPSGTFRIPRGADVSIEFDDGKGVSGKLAGVSIAPGGLPFSIVVTHDGRMPDDRPEMASDGADASPGGDYVSTVERADWAALREARLYRQTLTISRMQGVESDLRRQLAEVCAELGTAKDEVAQLTTLRAGLIASNENQARTIRELREHSVARSDDQGITLPPGGRPGHLVMTWHESDGSVTIRVEDH